MTSASPGDLLALTAELVDIPSESHHEQAITEHLAARLAASCPWLRLDRVGENLVARTELDRPMRVVLAGHTDTVPADRNLPGRTVGDVVWGCGSADMKSGLAVMVALAESISSPAIDVTYVFYDAEEVASSFNGLRRLFAERPDLVAGDVALLGEPTGGAIEAGCQGTMRAEVVLRGVRAHTARPWMGRNAIHRLGAVLERMARYQERRPVLDGCEYREAVQAVRVDGGVAGNVVPDTVTLEINHRFAPDRDTTAAKAHLRELFEDLLEREDELRIVDTAEGAQPSLDHPFLAALIARNGLQVRAKLGWTDVARFAAHGVPAANFGPGDATLAHTHDEHVARAPIEQTYGALAELLTTGP
jgi:succinyl-diaminopimelate desuccinylase